MVLLDHKKIMQFTVDITNTHDGECPMDVTKVLSTGETVLAESKLEPVRNSTRLSIVQSNSVYSIPCTHITQTLLCIYIKRLRK